MRGQVLAALILFAVGCSEPQTPARPSGSLVTEPPVNGVRVSGRVVDFATSLGVLGATVVFGDTRAVTDAGGSYILVVPTTGPYYPLVDGVQMGLSRVTGSGYRGDLLVRPGTCRSRYGTLADARTLRPVSGATVSLVGQKAMSGPDGWYRIDVGCPTNDTYGNTTFMYVSHPDYVDQS